MSSGPKTTAALCGTVPVARVNTLTGMDYDHADPAATLGFQGSACVYYSGATQGSSGHQLNADVIWAGDLAAAYASYQQELSGSETITPLNGVGVLAFTTPDTVVVDYGGLVITVNDSAQLADPLDVDQLRFVVDEIHQIYG